MAKIIIFSRYTKFLNRFPRPEPHKNEDYRLKTRFGLSREKLNKIIIKIKFLYKFLFNFSAAGRLIIESNEFCNTHNQSPLIFG